MKTLNLSRCKQWQWYWNVSHTESKPHKDFYKHHWPEMEFSNCYCNKARASESMRGGARHRYRRVTKPLAGYIGVLSQVLQVPGSLDSRSVHSRFCKCDALNIVYFSTWRLFSISVRRLRYCFCFITNLLHPVTVRLGFFAYALTVIGYTCLVLLFSPFAPSVWPLER